MEGRGVWAGSGQQKECWVASRQYLYPLGLQPPPGNFHLSWECRAVNSSFPYHKPFFLSRGKRVC